MKQQKTEEKQYFDFLWSLVRQVESLAPEGTAVSTRKIRRINGCVIDGIQIRRHDSTLSPAVYVKPYFTRYQRGADIRELAEHICRVCLDADKTPELNLEFFRNYSNLKGTIVYKVINYTANQHLLAGLPHIRILDLAIVYYCLIDRDEYFTSFVIRNQDLKTWGIPSQQLFREAAVNTPELLPPRVCPLNEILRDMMEEHIRNITKEIETFKKSLSNDPINLTPDPINTFDDPIKQQLYQAVVADGTLNYAAYAAQLGVSEATVKRRLGELKTDGIIIRVGSNKTGHWEVAKQK